MAGDRPGGSEPNGGSRGDPPWASTRIGAALPLAIQDAALPLAVPEPVSPGAAVKIAPAPRQRSWLWRLCVALLVALGLWCFYEYATLPDARPLTDRNPETTALIQARDAAARSQGKQSRHRQYWVALTSIAPRAVDSVIASEDASFFLHHGIDSGELSKVLEKAWRKGSLGRGASTITQQLAKNLWLSSDRSLLRKAKELILARRLEDALPKKRILALYLNVAEWGDGVYGIEAGSREHFGISASELSVGQGAILAAMLPAPRRWTPERRSPALRKRALWIIDRLQEAGKISPGEGETARSQIERLLAKDPLTPEVAPESDERLEEER